MIPDVSQVIAEVIDKSPGVLSNSVITLSLTKEIASSFFPSCKDGIVILKYTIYSPAPLNAMLIPYTKTGKRTTPPSMNTGTKAASGIKPNNAPI